MVRRQNVAEARLRHDGDQIRAAHDPHRFGICGNDETYRPFQAQFFQGVVGRPPKLSPARGRDVAACRITLRRYLAIGEERMADPDAERRLQVLEHHTELGSGYRVALKDLELRGVGNLLGPEQSGFVHAVGFDMYLRMLEETVRRVMDAGGRPKLVPSDVSLDLPAYLPDDYIPSQDAKLDVYRRLSALGGPEGIEELRSEVVRMKSKGMKSMILDLRLNPGGLPLQVTPTRLRATNGGLEISGLTGRLVFGAGRSYS